MRGHIEFGLGSRLARSLRFEPQSARLSGRNDNEWPAGYGVGVVGAEVEVIAGGGGGFGLGRAGTSSSGAVSGTSV